MNTKQMIEVMRAHANGEKIEERDRFIIVDWRPFRGDWDWKHLTFRIAPEPEPKKEGRWERVEIVLDEDGTYILLSPQNHWCRITTMPNIPGFGGIDYRSPFDPKVIVRSMVPIMFREHFGNSPSICNLTESGRPGIPVAAWFWREGEEK